MNVKMTLKEIRSSNTRGKNLIKSINKSCDFSLKLIDKLWPTTQWDKVEVGE